MLQLNRIDKDWWNARFYIFLFKIRHNIRGELPPNKQTKHNQIEQQRHFKNRGKEELKVDQNVTEQQEKKLNMREKKSKNWGKKQNKM